MHPAATSAASAAALGSAALTYAAGYEVRAYTVRRLTVPVLAAGSAPLRLLHLSDLHLTRAQRRKQRWLRALAELEPDLVVNTGDNLADPQAVAVVLDALGPLLDVPGVFVLGSNDYYGPILKNPVRYLLPSGQDRRVVGAPLPWRELRDSFTACGWVDLTNRTQTLQAHGCSIAFAGVDDPHLGYDDLAAVAGPGDATADVRIGVTHAPYRRVLDQFTADGYELILAGHTHGGQLRVPIGGALVTNCDLDTARARGLHHHAVNNAGDDDTRRSWLHVSAGLGTSPYAPVRFCCRPEASLLTLTAPEL
ncbi:MAG: metallophosphoesterase [Actinomycetota bacterium]|nr:metallophosphoesterase [Actinomycetota bacterium]